MTGTRIKHRVPVIFIGAALPVRHNDKVYYFSFFLTPVISQGKLLLDQMV
ncbi:MAG TPA: hypothetical protein GXX69_04680 [Firmicutes bacterium]|nr:hypothetical protein [Bacillota bacterium]